MDNLEKYIKQHRDEFDSEEPRPELWGRIKGSMEQKEARIVHMRNWMWRAAAIVLLMTTTWLLVERAQQPGPQDVGLAAEVDDSFMEEFAAAEQYYLNQIDEMQSQLVAYEDELVSGEFMRDLDHLDSLYTGLRSEFDTGGSNEQVADALIQNLRIRMEIINQQLMILERIKRQTSDENIQI